MGNNSLNPFTNDWLQASHSKVYKNQQGSTSPDQLNSGFKMQSNSKHFTSNNLSTSIFQTSSNFESKNAKGAFLTLSDSAKKTKAFYGGAIVAACGGDIGVNYTTNLNISPILAKSISCFDPVQPYDYFGLGPNHFHNEHIVEKNTTLNSKHNNLSVTKG